MTNFIYLFFCVVLNALKAGYLHIKIPRDSDPAHLPISLALDTSMPAKSKKIYENILTRLYIFHSIINFFLLYSM